MRVKLPAGPVTGSLRVPDPTVRSERCVARCFEAMVEEYPDRAAIRTLDCCVSYRDLNRRANRVAHALADACVSADRPVATLIAVSPAYTWAIVGALKAGRFYVSLAPDFPVESNRGVLAVAGPDVLLTDTENLHLAEELSGGSCVILNIDELDDSLPQTNPTPGSSPDSIAYMVFTSGSTGVPKGVYQNQRNLVAYCRSQVELLGITPADCISCCSTPPVFGTVTSVFVPLMAGAAVFPVNIAKLGFPGLRACLEQGHITVFTPYVTMFRRFAGTLSGNDDFGAVRLIRLVGEATTSLDFQRYRALFAPSCRLLTSYGSSEAMGICARFYDHDTQIGEGNLSPGGPLPGVELKILDEQGKPCAAGESGEIAVSSPFLSLGYWKREDLSRKVFVDQSGAGGHRILMTGDLGCLLPDGSLVHQGRRDFQVKIRGFRVELPAVELALLRIEGVEEASVVGIDNAMNEKELLAYYVPVTKQPLTNLRALLADTLPDYMVPSRVVALGSLPRTDSGKVNTALLGDSSFMQSAMLRDPHPEESATDAIGSTNQARNPGTIGTLEAAGLDNREQALADIWRRVLKSRELGADSRFFQAGGNSLDALELQSTMEQVFGVPVALERIFEDPTLAELAAQMPLPVASTGAHSKSLAAAHQDGVKTPFFMVTGSPARQALCMDWQRPFYQFNESPGDSSQNSIRDRARAYVEEIRRIQPTGPYLIGGYCNAGLVAVEIAAQLEAMQCRVEIVVIDDSECELAGRQPIPFGDRLAQLATRILGGRTKPAVAARSAHPGARESTAPGHAITPTRADIHLVVCAQTPHEIESKRRAWSACTCARIRITPLKNLVYPCDDAAAAELGKHLESVLARW